MEASEGRDTHVTYCDGQDGCGSVRRDGKELSGRRLVTQASNDRRQEERECIERGITAHVDKRIQPGLPIFHRSPEIFHFEGLMFS